MSDKNRLLDYPYPTTLVEDDSGDNGLTGKKNNNRENKGVIPLPRPESYLQALGRDNLSNIFNDMAPGESRTLDISERKTPTFMRLIVEKQDDNQFLLYFCNKDSKNLTTPIQMPIDTKYLHTRQEIEEKLGYSPLPTSKDCTDPYAVGPVTEEMAVTLSQCAMQINYTDQVNIVVANELQKVLG